MTPHVYATVLPLKASQSLCPLLPLLALRLRLNLGIASESMILSNHAEPAKEAENAKLKVDFHVSHLRRCASPKRGESKPHDEATNCSRSLRLVPESASFH